MRILAVALLGAALVAGAAQAKEPRQAYTPAGNAQARAVVVKLADLPAGWKADRSGGGGGGEITCAGFDPDQSDLTTVGSGETNFEHRDGLSFVFSGATVFVTPAQAGTGWRRVVRPAMLGCLARIFEQGASSGKTKTKVVASGRLRLPLSAPRKVAYRIVADVLTQGQHVKAYLDVILQGGGRVNTVLLVSTVLVPPQTVFERSLAGKVASRLP